MLDREGYRPNVGIILTNERNEVFWGKRVREHSWQFPQGGIKPGESPETAMYRELLEEVGLLPHHVKILGRTRDWLRYDVPSHWVRREWRGSYRGQKQIWYLLRLTGRDGQVHHVWVDVESGLDVRTDARRRVDGQERTVWTTYRDWRKVDGLLVPHLLETSVEGVRGTERIVVEKVALNVPLDDARFTAVN